MSKKRTSNNQNFNLMDVPEIYKGKLNTERIEQSRELAQLFNIDESTAREIFCKGTEWGIVLTNQSQWISYPYELLEEFKRVCLKFPDESPEKCYKIAKGWYGLRDFKSDLLPQRPPPQ